ncbi:hypothetical protein HBI56_124450 [Parastagonospora nodorum]|uniref:Uncharacterized protein n=1 Tax=Phaeosphaeria nodorum (strain SN15 / ATCC MYA-4574 / FGSC 10173) TaxID=321614 RepID=A0A7U2F4E7_PHANO|nr:hypothetical protein HBH56_165780 [Parastagonospora nodorum]QRC98513.1 hypothetical protein JI435_412190 [Parastagonospora nodorum SN15]KAH3936308.1 hypothetical protein HBH54_028870 [Parastagonospora nodorum]KAH3948121.1 hypothetical protein HBH53_103640 [Parastagonospora nodorum]KAH3968878.1 hypothetical protein HBH51_127540 [Parastagonospora nodorum]
MALPHRLGYISSAMRAWGEDQIVRYRWKKIRLVPCRTARCSHRSERSIALQKARAHTHMH